jgi:S-formylglutathione hydrolase FrmB
MTELIPYIEKNFRIIAEPYARAITGGSTGGWEALALQVYHPDFFGGTWVFFPDPIDFRQYGVVNIYDDDNAFFLNGSWGTKIERPMSRTSAGQTTQTIREASYSESVLGSKDRSGEQLAIWEATYGPVGEDGYPKPLWDPITGKIDHTVSAYMRDNGYDLRYLMETNWSTLGPKLKGKLRFYCGDMDNLFLNLGVYKMEEFLKATINPYYDGSFEYGRPLKGHGWHPMKNYELDKMIGQSILDNTPKDKLPVKWMYK